MLGSSARLPRLLLLDHGIKRRLAMADALNDSFDPYILAAGQDVLRHARAERPHMILLVVHPYRPSRSYNLCRSLKTSTRPLELVALVNLYAPSRKAGAVMGRFLADAFYQGPDHYPILCSFVRRAWAEQHHVYVANRPGWQIRALLGG